MRTLVAITALAVAGFACAGTPTEPSPTPVTVALDAASWQTISDPQPYPLANDGAALLFDFPATGSIQYLFAPSPLAAIHGTMVVTFAITTTGSVAFNSLDPQSSSCAIPSSVRPLIWANANGEGAYDRWWSNPRAVTLAAGQGSVTVPLKPENWSSVNGKFGNADAETTFQFEKALLNVTRLGVTFGGGCSFGHGISISGGTASFALTRFAIQ
jgi:hypothetical protein